MSPNTKHAKTAYPLLARAKTVADQLIATAVVADEYPVPLKYFTKLEQAFGAERRDLVIEVAHLKLGRPDWSEERCVRRIAQREELEAHKDPQDRKWKFSRLYIGGRLYGNQINYGNFKGWKARWKPWRLGPFDTSNWHCLCDRYRLREVVDARGRKTFVPKSGYTRPGDTKFWAIMESLYETPEKRSRIDAYNKAVEAARKAGGFNIPKLRQVQHYYLEHVRLDKLAAAREGAKRYRR